MEFCASRCISYSFRFFALRELDAVTKPLAVRIFDLSIRFGAVWLSDVCLGLCAFELCDLAEELCSAGVLRFRSRLSTLG